MFMTDSTCVVGSGTCWRGPSDWLVLFGFLHGVAKHFRRFSSVHCSRSSAFQIDPCHATLIRCRRVSLVSNYFAVFDGWFLGYFNIRLSICLFCIRIFCYRQRQIVRSMLLTDRTIYTHCSSCGASQAVDKYSVVPRYHVIQYTWSPIAEKPRDTPVLLRIVSSAKMERVYQMWRSFTLTDCSFIHLINDLTKTGRQITTAVVAVRWSTGTSSFWASNDTLLFSRQRRNQCRCYLLGIWTSVPSLKFSTLLFLLTFILL